ncbi:MAG: DUF3267 domain-containing protein [Anaerolineae bacterium]|nr:DUF3267 domain-containing protein [Anaerolineae bacterium]
MTRILHDTPNPIGPVPAGYQAVDYTVELEALPPWVLWSGLLLMVVPVIPFILWHGWNAFWGHFAIVPSIIGFVVLIVAHELVHAIGWKLTSGLPWRRFRFGVLWRVLAPYCHAKDPMALTPYRIGAVLPLFVTGLLPWVIGLVQADATLTVVGAMLISGAIGDIYVLWVLRDLPATALVQDHPSKAGCIAYLPTTDAQPSETLRN